MYYGLGVQNMSAFWAYLTNVQTTQPTAKNWRVWLFSGIGLLCGSLFLTLFPLYYIQVLEESERNYVWLTIAFLQAVAIILVSLFIGIWQPSSLATRIEQRRGRILNTIVCIIIVSIGSGLWLQLDIYRIPLVALNYVNQIVFMSQIVWLARKGNVYIGAVLALVLFTFRISVSISLASISIILLFYLFGILIAGLLIRWWLGMLVALAFPLLYFLMATQGLIINPETAIDVGIYTVVLISLSSIVALYAQSLEQALQQADARATELTEAQTHLASTNVQLEGQTRTLQSTQDELRRLVTEQEAQIAEAVATIRERSIEINTIQTPLIRVVSGVLVAPLIGTWDQERSELFLSNVLGSIEQQKVYTIVFDMTGLTLLNDATAQMLEQALRAAQLLGCRGILVGIQPEMAQTLVNLNLDFSTTHTASDLADAIMYSLRHNQQSLASLRS